MFAVTFIGIDTHSTSLYPETGVLPLFRIEKWKVKIEKSDFHFSAIFNNLVVIENAGTSMYRISVHPIPDGH